MTGKRHRVFLVGSGRQPNIAGETTFTNTMKQPELGKKILELRKAKGLTQEELVERCNISVRTIQRIESGEVTPRVYTIKTILAALDYDISTIKENGSGFLRKVAKGFSHFLLLDLDSDPNRDFLIHQLRIAWILGLVYFIVGFLEGAAEYFRYEEDRLIFSEPVYVVIKCSVLVSYIFFQRGFIVLGTVFRNYLLKIVAYMLIFGNILVLGYDMASVFYNSVEREFVLGAEALTFGAIGILYGISLFRLKSGMGDLARYAGLFALITGIFFLTVVLAFVGLILQIPSELLEIILLYKGMELIGKNSDREITGEANLSA